MERIIIIVHTYFQLIVAVNLKMTQFINDKVDIIVSNHSVDSLKIYNNLKNMNLFNDVFYYTSPEKIKGDLISKFVNIYKMLFSKNDLKEKVNLKDNKFFFYNITQETYQLYDYFRKKNENIKICRFEEGFISYLHFNNMVSKKYLFIRKLLNRKIFFDTDYTYIFYPELLLYNTNSKIMKISPINKKNKELVKNLNSIFDYKEVVDEYKPKYIFFEESFFCDGFEIDDLKLVLNIADVVGKENLLVKLHPRNKIDRFKEYGIQTNKTIGIPWEIIQMNNDFSNKVFLTISSGSVLASKLYFNEEIKTYLLFNCTDKMSNAVTKEYHKYLSNKNELLELLRKRNNK